MPINHHGKLLRYTIYCWFRAAFGSIYIVSSSHKVYSAIIPVISTWSMWEPELWAPNNRGQNTLKVIGCAIIKMHRSSVKRTEHLMMIQIHFPFLYMSCLIAWKNMCCQMRVTHGLPDSYYRRTKHTWPPQVSFSKIVLKLGAALCATYYWTLKCINNDKSLERLYCGISHLNAISPFPPSAQPSSLLIVLRVALSIRLKGVSTQGDLCHMV